ncbi:DNA-binding anti-repressor SinI [Salibacterium salarium]|uniref:DNA-binding anti-repressor SinI n=1 Tax=Salibacterium salarium TaxID=284579 RepID=A0A3R9QIV9_9BACI|nr:anti-repressor SinI family protein [Salibacterium salarium]RSL31710.1 DNA-binding anti-repressor SinI [Salibacterium salarium]
MSKNLNNYNQLDEEWVQLIDEAKHIGLSPGDVLSFLKTQETSEE